MPDDSPILKEIRDNFEYARNYWAPIREQAEKDVRYSVEGPWDPGELDERKGRVTLTLDELSQYLNQICNEFRQHQRSVKVNPRGDGADDQTALMRAAMIREIEYQSKAQQAYVTGGEDMVRRSYGYVKVKTDWEPGSFRRCLKVARVQNPDVIYLDPDAKEADWSDAGWGFETERMREAEFRSRFGDKATVTDFDGLDGDISKNWVTAGDDGRHIQVAAYWKRLAKKTPLYLLDNGMEVNSAKEPGLQVVKQGKAVSVVVQGQQYAVVDQRDDNEYTVTQYISNGLEILEENPSDFTEIPIIPMFGREVWVTNAGKSRRVFLSAIRLARDAYKAYCYARSAMVERLAMDPKTPYEGWEGQFDTQTDFTQINKNQQGYAEFKLVTLPNGQVLTEKPTRNLVEPQIGQYETAAESLRRCIQAAIGGSPLPTSAQRQNQKSGVALQTIEQSSDQGNFHFIDNYDRALERVGRMLDQALDIVYDTPREVGLRSESGEYSTAKINQVDEQGNKVGFHTATGDHGVTISTGPSSQSMRDEADKFLDGLAQNEAIFPKVADLVVKMKNLGPIGDQIAARLAPPGAADGLPPGLAQQIQSGQQEIAQLKQELQAAKAGDAIKKYTVDEQEKTKRVLGLVKVDQQDAETRLDQMLGAIDQRFQKLHEAHQSLLQQQHEREMQAADHAQAGALAQQQAEQQAAQPAQ